MSFADTAIRLAAPAPIDTDDDLELAAAPDAEQLHLLAERWVQWSRTRRLYGPAPITGSLLGKLSGASARPVCAGGPDAICSAELAAFHIAYTCQPDALDKRAFDLYYVHRIKPVKASAAALGITHRHFYRLVGDFRRRVARAAEAIATDALASAPLR